MTATREHDSTRPAPVLYLAFELAWGEWKLGFATSAAQPVRQRCMRARDLAALQQEIAKAKQRFQLPPETAVRCCYEAGRDGFWLHRYLSAAGIDNVIVDSASIEVNRRSRRAKSDRLDVEKLARMLLRYHGGERQVWRVVRVPSVLDEDRRQLHRDLQELKAERTQHTNRMKGLLASLGLATEIGPQFAEHLQALRTWDDAVVPAGMQQRLLREFARWQFVDQQIGDLERARGQEIRTSAAEPVHKVRQLLALRGIGANSAWLYVMEFFGWRQIRNRRELGALAGLTPTPYQSGDSEREQGISKAGNRRLRTMAIEIAWGWLHYQPASRLSLWYQERFGKGTSRVRKIGIVALARKLLVALWRYLEEGELPAGAVLKTPSRKQPAGQELVLR